MDKKEKKKILDFLDFYTGRISSFGSPDEVETILVKGKRVDVVLKNDVLNIYNISKKAISYISNPSTIPDSSNELYELASRLSYESVCQFCRCYVISQKHLRNLSQNFIARDIVQLVRNNKSKHITERNIVCLLRGTSIESNKPLNMTDSCGKYRLLSERDITDMIDDLCNYRILKSNRQINKYGKYYQTIETGEYMPNYISETKRDVDLSEIPTDKNNLTDEQAYVLWFDDFDPSDLNHNMLTCDLLHCKGFVCLHIDDIIDYAFTAGSMFQDYFKIIEKGDKDMFVKTAVKKIRLELAK